MNCCCSAYYPAQSRCSLKANDPKACLAAIVSLIEDVFDLRTNRTKPIGPSEIIDPLTSNVLVKTTPTEEVIEVTPDIFSKIFGHHEEGVLGCYDIPTGKIFLIKEKWCFSTIIHEALHGRSIFSKTPLPSNLEFAIEGITEHLVGVVLKKALPECYKQWQTIDFCFHNYYEEFVKPWYYLSYRMDFRPIIQLYFDLNEKNPIRELGKILERAFDNGCAKLFEGHSPERTSFFQDFRDALGKAFKADFAEFMNTDLRESIILDKL